MNARAVQNHILRLSQSGRTGYFLALLICLPALSLMAIDMYVPAFPMMMAEFGTTSNMVQLSMVSYLLGFSLFQFIIGPLSDYYGRKKIILSGLFIFILASYVCSLPHHIGMFIAARVFQAIGASAIGGVGRTLARDLFKDHALAKFMGHLSTTIQIFPMISPTLGAYLVHYLGWHSVFIFLASFGALVFVLFYFLLPETNTAMKQGPVKLSRIIRGYKFVFSEPRIWIYAIASGAAFSGGIVYYTITPFLFQNIYHVGTILYGWLALAVSIFVFIGKFLNTILLRHLEPDRVLSIGAMGFVLSGISMILLASLGFANPYAVMAPFTLYALGAGLIFSNASSMALSAFHKNIGMVGSVYSATQIFISMLSSMIASHFHVKNAMPLALTLFSLSLLVCAILFWRYRVNKDN